MRNNSQSDLTDRYEIASIEERDDSTISSELSIEDKRSIDTIEHVSPTKKQSWREIFMLSFSSLGVIYGDLGTSPLYTLSSIRYKKSPPTEDEIYGAVSVIFYIFTIIVIIKYVLIVLVIGANNGEGGQVAIYGKIAHQLNIGPKGVTMPGAAREVSDIQLVSRQDTMASSVESYTSRIEHIRKHPRMIVAIKGFILTCCFIGCALVVSDGLLTPTASILSAIGGIQVAVPSFKSVLAVSEVILVVLFSIQQFGSNKISFLFAPIIFIWLIGLMICGIYNIAKYQPGIFAALSPHYTIKILQESGIDVLGGAMLSITGTEAMFADLGHFGRLPIQLTLGCFVYPTLIICYLGQAAYLVHHPDAYINPFFLSLPGGTGGSVYWAVFVFATIATVIASQALILSVFSIFAQLIHLDCFPKLKITHVSSGYAGKVYIGAINWMLMIGVMLTMAGFQNSHRTTAAYGLGISLDLFVTSLLILICMFYVYNWHIIWPILFLLIFGPLEFSLIISNMKKVPRGAWFPIMVTVLLSTFLSVWRWCRSRKVEQEFNSKIKIGDLFPYFKKAETIEINLNHKESNQEGSHQFGKTDVKTRFGILPLTRHEGLGIMYVDSILTNSPNTLPDLYTKLVTTFVSIPSHFVFCAIRVMSIPFVPDEQRLFVAPMKLPDHYKCVIRFGYMELTRIDKAMVSLIMSKIPALSGLNEDQLEKYPKLHIFENDLIRCHEYEPTKNVFRKVARLIRMIIIEHFFSPLSSLTSEYGRFLKVPNAEEERDQKIFIGQVARI